MNPYSNMGYPINTPVRPIQTPQNSYIHAEGEATRALINANVMQELRDQLQAAQLQLGNLSRTQDLVSQLRPVPIPAYITCSPYGNCACSTTTPTTPAA